MKNEEALKILQNNLDFENGKKGIYPCPIEQYKLALEVAIEALQTHDELCDSYKDNRLKCGCFLETGLQMKWIPIKMRDMTDEEIQDYEDRFGPSVGDEDHLCFDCRMPEDGQEILISTQWGVEKDTCTYDFEYGYGLETNDDWDGVDAWMPCPEKYKEEEQNEN